MITHFDHVYSPLRDNDLDGTLGRFQRAGFLIGEHKCRHACGRQTGFAHMTGSYLEFLSVVDEAEFQREATVEDRIFRLCPRPYGIGARTNNARGVHRSIKSLHPATPPLMSRPALGSRDARAAWTFTIMARRAFPGANVFAVQYHRRKRETFTPVRQGPNGIFALGGFVFCAEKPVVERARWHDSLNRIAAVAPHGSRLELGGQQLEWISPAQYRRRMGQPYAATPLSAGGLAAVKLLCANLREACRYLTAEEFSCVRATDTSALFAPDANTGYAFELIQREPSAFVRSMRTVSA